MRTHNLLRCLSRDHEVRQYSQGRTIPALTRRETPEGLSTPSYRYFVDPSLVNGLAAAFGSRWWCGNVFAGVDLPISRPAELTRMLAWADVVVVEQPWQFRYCRRLRPDKPLVLSAHNVELRARASHAEAAGVKADPDSLLLRWVRRVEAGAARGADLIVAVSEADRSDFLDCYCVPPSQIVVVANGTDTRQFVPAPTGQRLGLRERLGLPGGPLAVFMAAHRKAPDVAALERVRRLAGRMPNCTFVVTGGVLRPGAEGNLIATGWVEDVVPYLQAADLALCPVAHGGGTKLKLFDSLGVGLPVIAFAEALEGTSLRAGEDLLVCEHSDSAFEESARRILGDARLAVRLGSAGRAFVVRRHDWEQLSAQLERALVELVDGSSHASARSNPRAYGQPRPAA